MATDLQIDGMTTYDHSDIKSGSPTARKFSTERPDLARRGSTFESTLLTQALTACAIGYSLKSLKQGDINIGVYTRDYWEYQEGS